MAGRQSRVDGLADTIAFVESLPEAARDEMAVELGIIGREILAAQHADVAKDTGQLDAALSMRVLVDRLKMRAGLFGSGTGRSNSRSRNLFIGRLVEGGRKAQTVTVTRHIKNRQLRGNNKNGNKRRTVFGGKPYTMKVRAIDARPFIAQPLLHDAADLHLAEYWSKVLTRAGGGA